MIWLKMLLCLFYDPFVKFFLMIIAWNGGYVRTIAFNNNSNINYSQILKQFL